MTGKKIDLNELIAIVTVLTAMIGFCVGSIYVLGEVLHLAPKAAFSLGIVVGLSLTSIFFWFVLGMIGEYLEASKHETKARERRG